MVKIYHNLENVNNSAFINNIINSIDLHLQLDDKQAELAQVQTEQQHITEALPFSIKMEPALKNFYSLGNLFPIIWTGIQTQLEKCYNDEIQLQGSLDSPLGILPGDIILIMNVWNSLATALQAYIAAI